jgi:hypothetical protein
MDKMKVLIDQWRTGVPAEPTKPEKKTRKKAASA